MRGLPRFWLAFIITLSALHASAQGLQSLAQPIGATPVKCGPAGRALGQEGFVRLGGIEQWVTIKGSDCRNPVILFVHGGPGNPNTPFAEGPYGAWVKDFTLVNWDQRGAGRTYGRNPVADPDTPERVLTIERMAQDGTELAAYLAKYLKTDKVILFGGSWGSVLSVHMAKSRPDLFVAYVGTGQMVGHIENNVASYRKALELARAANDVKTLAVLEGLGAPPWINPRSPGQLRRVTRVYEAKLSAPAPASWWVKSPAYATPQMQADYTNGEAFSWVQFVGMKGDGMLSSLDLRKLGLDFKIPVFMVQGAHDLVTVPEIAKRYFDDIKAPHKEYFLLPNTGHDPNPEMVEAQYSILKTRVLPLVK